MNDNLSPFFRPHLLFTADDVASIDAPADLIHRDSQTADAALINISLLHTLFYHFFYRLLYCHIPLLVALSFITSIEECRNHWFTPRLLIRSSRTSWGL